MISILAAFMVFGTSACTSKKATDENADVEASGAASDESLESAEAVENNSDLTAEAGDNAVADLGGDDGLAPEEKLPDDKAPPALADNSAPAAGDLTETPAAPADATTDMAATETPPPADMSTPPPAEPMSPPTPEPAIADSSSSSPAPAVGALKKINAQPYRQGKQIVNAVYIARNGDTVEGISQKVFGSQDHVKDLCKINSYNCSRGIKVGDKFYYNSPQRPTDDTVVKTFYEDAGVAPQVYTAKSGDNIRKVGKQLLGHERSWMELWATNEVESKGDLDEGTQLKYWPTSDAAVPALAKTEEAAPAATPPTEDAANTPPPAEANQDPNAAAPPDQAANTPPPPPADSLPPPPEQNAAAAAGTVEPPPPPPPPPPTDMAGNKEPVDASAGAAAAGQDQTMALGVGAVLLLAAAALFISIRKKRARRQIDFNTATQTQIE